MRRYAIIIAALSALFLSVFMTGAGLRKHPHPPPTPTPTVTTPTPTQTSATPTVTPTSTSTGAVWSSSAQYGTYQQTVGGITYHWNNDAWCPSHGPETIWANSPNDWGVTSQQTFSQSCWVMTYPHIGWWGGGALSSYAGLSSSEAETGPGYGGALQWEAAYDIWLNNGSPGSDSGYEIMIWTDTSGVAPCCSIIAKPVIDGVTFDLYQSQGGNGPASWFVREGNVGGGTFNLKDFIAYIASHGGNYPGPFDPQVDTVEFGWEVWGTGGVPVSFHVSQYSLVAR